MAESEFPTDAVVAIADIFETHQTDEGIDGAGCLNEAAQVCQDHDIEDVERRIDLICEGAGWYMEREKLDLQSMLRTELSEAAEVAPDE